MVPLLHVPLRIYEQSADPPTPQTPSLRLPRLPSWNWGLELVASKAHRQQATGTISPTKIHWYTCTSWMTGMSLASALIALVTWYHEHASEIGRFSFNHFLVSTLALNTFSEICLYRHWKTNHDREGIHPRISNMAGWKISMFNRKLIFKWWIFHWHVGFREIIIYPKLIMCISLNLHPHGVKSNLNTNSKERQSHRVAWKNATNPKPEPG